MDHQKEVRYNPIKGLYDFPNKVRTVSGKYIDLFNLTPEDIDIEDIAYGLAHTARFGGQTRRYYSVAEHAIVVSVNLPLELKLAGLLHDASEAYIGDMPSPVKNRLPDYKYLEDHIMSVVAQKYGFKWPLEELVVKQDRETLESEWESIVLCDLWDEETPKHNIIGGFLTMAEHLIDEWQTRTQNDK